MDWIERLNKAMEYLEEHMTEENFLRKGGAYRMLFHLSFSEDVCLYGKRATFRIYPPQEDVSGC